MSQLPALVVALDDRERLARGRALAAAHHSCDIEGLLPAYADDLVLQQRWVEGELDADEVVAELIRRHGATP